ncbi:dihydropteroate synthase [Roseibaca sp. Y0-43]|uniref:dihydropteroate synthase n=1 Tax=Roseibaca sp. Y0-43 TaxID=2816854 RepID=UPI001D0C7C0E|nr:dihydropteroate synthase [Roseibaca sp. Y0-43]MCC1480638.1 dihydropteroate synthase [Roseibaca sp. Y0-43]
MSYLLPILRPASLAPTDAPALRGQSALRLVCMQELGRDGALTERAVDPMSDSIFLDPPAPIAGLSLTRPALMGIVNVTPDSFSDGGRFATQDRAVAHAQRLLAEGADILDIGGESTRPGAAEVAVEDEIARTAPVIAGLRAAGVTAAISIDTRKARVAEAALHAGADIVNDVSALTWDRDMARVVADAGVPICLMHAQGTPQTMQKDPKYKDVRFDVHDWLAAAMDRALAAGIDPARLILDPGIGFGKTVAHNLALLSHLALLHGLGCAILLGASRKRFIGVLGAAEQADARLPGSLAVALQGAAQGAQILRVHDVGETRQALALWRAMSEKTELGGT